MSSFQDLVDFFAKRDFKVIIASDAETRVHGRVGNQIVATVPVGGVGITFDPIAQASGAVCIARGKTPEDREVLGKQNKIEITDTIKSYFLKRIFFSDEDFDHYYNGFSNQTLWPLCHVTFERPEIQKEWYEGYKRVNKKFAQAILEEVKGKTFIWVNDYQLSLVPKYLGRPKNTIVAMFWHIPWPTWEVFRILPFKKEVLESLLACDFLAFHRGYQARNFIKTVDRELEVRVDEEKNAIHYNNSITTVENLPMGIDTDVIKSLVHKHEEASAVTKIVNVFTGSSQQIQSGFSRSIERLFGKYKVLLGVDRLDYTKGLILRFKAIELFFKKNPKYIGKVVYLGILSPSRESIPAYKELKKVVYDYAKKINTAFSTEEWKPIQIISQVFTRDEIVGYYSRADVCLVTPRDDGMNLVSKEFVVASSQSENPGMLVLSQFAGSAIDLTASLIVNPYDIDELAEAIKRGLEMNIQEKKKRIQEMVETLEEKNIYEWAKDFVGDAVVAAGEKNR